MLKPISVDLSVSNTITWLKSTQLDLLNWLSPLTQVEPNWQATGNSLASNRLNQLTQIHSNWPEMLTQIVSNWLNHVSNLNQIDSIIQFKLTHSIDSDWLKLPQVDALNCLNQPAKIASNWLKQSTPIDSNWLSWPQNLTQIGSTNWLKLTQFDSNSLSRPENLPQIDSGNWLNQPTNLRLELTQIDSIDPENSPRIGSIQWLNLTQFDSVDPKTCLKSQRFTLQQNGALRR